MAEHRDQRKEQQEVAGREQEERLVSEADHRTCQEREKAEKAKQQERYHGELCEQLNWQSAGRRQQEVESMRQLEHIQDHRAMLDRIDQRESSDPLDRKHPARK